jgi:hypothetical protein
MPILAAQPSPSTLSSSCVLLLAQAHHSAVVQTHACVQRRVHGKDPLLEGCAVSITALTIATSNSKKRYKEMPNDAAAPALSQHTRSHTAPNTRQGITQICARTRLRGLIAALPDHLRNVYHSLNHVLNDKPVTGLACWLLCPGPASSPPYNCTHTCMITAAAGPPAGPSYCRHCHMHGSQCHKQHTGSHHWLASHTTQYLTTPELPSTHNAAAMLPDKTYLSQ